MLPLIQPTLLRWEKWNVGGGGMVGNCGCGIDFVVDGFVCNIVGDNWPIWLIVCLLMVNE